MDRNANLAILECIMAKKVMNKSGAKNTNLLSTIGDIKVWDISLFSTTAARIPS